MLGDDDLWVKYGKHTPPDDNTDEDDTEALGPPSECICTNCAWAIFLMEIYQWWVDNVRTPSGYEAEEEEDVSGSEADSIGGHSPLATEASSSDNGDPNLGSSEATGDTEIQPADAPPDDAVAAVEREPNAGGEDSGSSVAGTAAEFETGFTTDEDLDFEEAVVEVLAATP